MNTVRFEQGDNWVRAEFEPPLDIKYIWQAIPSGYQCVHQDIGIGQINSLTVSATDKDGQHSYEAARDALQIRANRFGYWQPGQFAEHVMKIGRVANEEQVVAIFEPPVSAAIVDKALTSDIQPARKINAPNEQYKAIIFDDGNFGPQQEEMGGFFSNFSARIGYSIVKAKAAATDRQTA